MTLSIANEDADHPLSAIADTRPRLPSDLKKSLAQSRQQPAPHSQSKLAGVDSSFYELDLNSDPLQPSDTQVNKAFGSKNPVPTADGITPPPKLHFNEHHQHYRHRHEAMTIGDMSEPQLLTDSVMAGVKLANAPKGGKDHTVISSTYTESPIMVDPAEFVGQGGIRGKGPATRPATKPLETVVDIAADASSQTTATPSIPASNAVNAGNYPSYSASFFRGWFDLPPSLSGQSPMQRPRLSLSMQGTAPAPSTLPTSSSSPPSKTHEAVNIPMGPVGPVKRRNEVYGSGHHVSFALGEAEEDAGEWGMGASSHTERESRRGQMAL